MSYSLPASGKSGFKLIVKPWNRGINQKAAKSKRNGRMSHPEPFPFLLVLTAVDRVSPYSLFRFICISLNACSAV